MSPITDNLPPSEMAILMYTKVKNVDNYEFALDSEAMLCYTLLCKTHEKRRKLMRNIHSRKRVLALLLLCLTLLTVVGCSGQSSGTEQSSDKNSETEAKESTSMTTEKETEAVLPKCTGVFAGTANFDTFVKRNGRTFFSERARAEYFNYSLSGFSFRFSVPEPRPIWFPAWVTVQPIRMPSCMSILMI